MKLSGNIKLTGALFVMPNPMLELSQELECTLKKISTSANRIYARKVCELSSTARVRTFSCCCWVFFFLMTSHGSCCMRSYGRNVYSRVCLQLAKIPKKIPPHLYGHRSLHCTVNAASCCCRSALMSTERFFYFLILRLL